MRIGFDSAEDTPSISSAGYPTGSRSGPNIPTTSITRSGKSKRLAAFTFTPRCTRSKEARVDPSHPIVLREAASSQFTSCIPASYLVSPSRSIEKVSCLTQGKLAAFTLISSVDIPYHDDLLLGRLRTDEDSSNFTVTAHDEVNSLPLRLLRLPRSSPLTGFAGLVDFAVSLEARVLTRGFLTIFEEVDGLGVWRRHWCQLRADNLRFWFYSKNGQSVQITAPLGRTDLQHVAAPRVAPAPRRICARANTKFMRSIPMIEPGWLSASINASPSGKDSNKSILFRSSPDHRWLEQRHFLSADTVQERDSWIKWFKLSLDALNDWMPEHFACLAAYDARLDFSQPVSSSLSALRMHGDCH
ncbi:unnamed protein product [Dicrocoelium dendriticum]|nr:unnamed protein product [Dicrocoelium dendriticum]